MRLDRIGMALVFVAGLVVFGGAASAASPESDRGDAYETPPLARLIMDNVGRLLVLRTELGVTDDQKQQIRAIVQRHRKEIAPAATAVVDKRKALREVVINKPGDRDAIRSAAADLGKALGEAAIVRAKVISEIKPTLKPEQQDRIKKFRADLDKSTAAWLDEFGK